MLIHIDTKGYTEKPKEHISIIKPRLQGANTIKDIDLETLIKYIQRGYSTLLYQIEILYIKNAHFAQTAKKGEKMQKLSLYIDEVLKFYILIL